MTNDTGRIIFGIDHSKMPVWPADPWLTQDQLLAFVNHLAQHRPEYEASERRAEPPHSFIAEIPAVPLDEHFHPAGNNFTAFSRDISTCGIALYHTKRVLAPYLALRLFDPYREAAVRATIKIVRRQQKGRFYEIGGRFVYKLYLHGGGDGAEQGSTVEATARA